jgi:phospholipase/carboxylesterase
MPIRRGRPPRTTSGIPHLQLNQWAARDLADELWHRMRRLPHVTAGGSEIGPMSARAAYLDARQRLGPLDAFIADGEFAHLHGDGSGSLHLALPPQVGAAAVGAGWAIFHPFAGRSFLPTTTVMVFGPRDQDELEVVWNIVEQSYVFASGSR